MADICCICQENNDNHKRKPPNNNEEPMLVPVNASDIQHDIQTTDDILRSGRYYFRVLKQKEEDTIGRSLCTTKQESKPSVVS